MKIFEVGFPKSKFSRDFPWKCYFLKIHFQKEFLIFLKNQSWFSDISKTRFSGFQFPKFWISFSKEFSYKFSIIFLRKFSKSEFSWQVFSFSNIHLFSRILPFSRDSHFFMIFQIFINFLEISQFFFIWVSSLEIDFHLFPWEMLFNSKCFLSIHHSFPTYILQNLIAHAWILCAFRIEHNFDNFTKSSTILVLGSITPVKGGRNGRTSYRQVEPHPMDFPAIFKTEASISKHFPKSGQVWIAKAFSSLFRKEGKTGKNFATITGLATVMGPVLVWSKLCLT